MAIQISGTSVINNSRQLQNIASLDSTTSSTIAASLGGGGGWSRRTTGGFANNSTALDITFPTTGGTSREYMIVFPKITGINPGTTLKQMVKMLLFNSSYQLMQTHGDYRGYDAGGEANSNTFRSDIPLTCGFGYGVDFTMQGSIRFHNNPTSSQTKTMIDYSLSGVKQYNNTLHTVHGQWVTGNIEATPRFRLYTIYSGWGAFSSSSTNYEVWGLDV